MIVSVKRKGILFTAALLIMSGITASAIDTQRFINPNITIFVDNKKLESDVEPFIKDDTTLAPARAVFEALGAQVDWQDNKCKVTKDGITVEIENGRTSIMVDNKEIYAGAASVIKDDRMMIPIRAVSEAFGDTVKWYGESRLVEITSKEQVQKQQEDEEEKIKREEAQNKPKVGIVYLNPEEDEYFAEKYAEDNAVIFDSSKWPEKNCEAYEQGVKISTHSESEPVFNDIKLTGGAYKFNMQIDNPNSWPQLVFSSADKEDYTKSSCYMIGFEKDYIELQRFNSGERTVIYGTDTFMAPIKGGAIDNRNAGVVGYGKKYTAELAVLDETDGTRIVLKINNKTIINYLDTDKARLKAEGYLGVYTGADGSFTFSLSE